jgi:hypothetical protein
MSEFNEVYNQASDRVKFATDKLKTAQEKLQGYEKEKQQAELSSLTNKISIAQDDLKNMIKTAPEKTATKNLEFESKKAELANKEASYIIDLTLWENDNNNKGALISKKTIDSKKVIETILRNSTSDFSDYLSIHSGINRIFGFHLEDLSSSDRNQASYVGWNASGLRQLVQLSWRDANQNINDLRSFLDSIE